MEVRGLDQARKPASKICATYTKDKFSKCYYILRTVLTLQKFKQK